MRALNIDELEAPLREAHAIQGKGLTFQDFVDRTRSNHGRLRETAIAYNRAVFEMQRNWK